MTTNKSSQYWTLGLILLMAMVVIGGTGSITGSILAAGILTFMVEILRPIEEVLVVYGINEIIVSIVLLLILVFRPRGFFGSVEPLLVNKLLKIKNNR